MPGTQHLADYFTKHFPGVHHKMMRLHFRKYICRKGISLEDLQRKKLLARQGVELAQVMLEQVHSKKIFGTQE